MAGLALVHGAPGGLAVRMPRGVAGAGIHPLLRRPIAFKARSRGRRGRLAGCHGSLSRPRPRRTGTSESQSLLIVGNYVIARQLSRRRRISLTTPPSAEADPKGGREKFGRARRQPTVLGRRAAIAEVVPEVDLTGDGVWLL